MRVGVMQNHTYPFFMRVSDAPCFLAQRELQYLSNGGIL